MATQQELRVRVGLDGRGFETGIRRLEISTERFAQNLKGQFAAAFGVAALQQYIRQIVKTVEKIKDFSEQLNVSTGEAQELQFAAAQSGMTLEDFGTALTRLTAARRDAAEGNEGLRRSFERLGVSLRDLNNPAARNVDLVRQIAHAISRAEMTAADSAALRDLFGRSGERLTNALKELSKPGRAPIISDKDIQNIDRLSKQLEVLDLRLKALGARAIGAGINAESKFGRVLRMMPFLNAPFLGFDLVNRGAEELTKPGAGFPSGRQPTRAAMMGQLFAEKPEKEKMDSGSIRKQLIELAPHLNELQRIGGAGGERGRLVQTVEVTNRKLDEANKNLRDIERGIKEKEAL